MCPDCHLIICTVHFVNTQSCMWVRGVSSRVNEVVWGHTLTLHMSSPRLMLCVMLLVSTDDLFVGSTNFSWCIWVIDFCFNGSKPRQQPRGRVVRQSAAEISPEVFAVKFGTDNPNDFLSLIDSQAIFQINQLTVWSIKYHSFPRSRVISQFSVYHHMTEESNKS